MCLGWEVKDIGGDIGRFKNSGQFAASIGLVPKQNSTGGNITLNGITKCGPKRLRANLVQCGQVILMYADKLKGNFGDWVRKLRDSGKKRGSSRKSVERGLDF